MLASDPALRPERLDVIAPNVLPVIGRVRVQSDDSAFRHKNRRRAVRASAAGENGVSDCGAGDTAGRPLEAQRLEQHVFEEREGFQGFEGQGAIAQGQSLLAEFSPHVGFAGEVKEDVGESDAGAVAGGEEDVEDLEAQVDGVADLFGHFVDEDVPVRSRRVVSRLGARLGLRKSAGHVLVDESVYLPVRVLPFLVIKREDESELAGLSTASSSEKGLAESVKELLRLNWRV